MNKNNITKEQMLMAQNAMKNAKDILCKCGGGIFNQAVKLKKISKLLIGAEEDVLVPISIFQCSSCLSEVNVDEEPAPNNEIVLDYKGKINK